MGRKKIPQSARRQVITCSLKPATNKRMEEAIPARVNRSRWIEQAINQKLDNVEFGNAQTFSNKKLLAMIHGRITSLMNGSDDVNKSAWKMKQDLSFLLEQIGILHKQYLEEF